MRWAERERMLFIDARMNVQNFVNRKHLMEKFGISAAQASNDLNNFMRRYLGRMIYDKTAKRFVRDPNNNSGPCEPRHI